MLHPCLHPCSPISLLWEKGWGPGWTDLTCGLTVNTRAVPPWGGDTPSPSLSYLWRKRASSPTLSGAALSPWRCAWSIRGSAKRWVPISLCFQPSVKDELSHFWQGHGFISALPIFSFYVATSVWPCTHTGRSNEYFLHWIAVKFEANL